MHKLVRIVSGILMTWLAACYPAPKAAGQFTDQEFNSMAKEMAKGDTKDISIEDFIRKKDNVIVLDSREKKEYDISHIPGAIWVGYDDFSADRIPENNKNQEVVVYCSVGYRSERIGEKLQKLGYNNVYNLEGSIFKWINEGYHLVDKDGAKTTKIHGYNSKWAKWIKNGEVVY